MIYSRLPTISPQQVAAAFDLGGRVLDVQPLGRGLINDTYLVTTDALGCRFVVLQRINRRAFPQPELIIQNLRLLTRHARAQDKHTLRIPELFAARNGQDFVLDDADGFWRAQSYIENTTTLESLRSEREAEATGAALGQFHTLASGIDLQRLHATRPHFHQTPFYFTRFTDVAATAENIPASIDLKWCTDFAEARRKSISTLENAKQQGELILRVIHGDPKLDNFLFDAIDGHVVSLIDLDTVQPGLVHYDIGDCLRSCANPAGESPADLDDIRFDLDICHALLKGYLNEARNLLTPTDHAYLYEAIRLIPLELGLRFLTDHLENDTYFKTEWRGQNLHRAMGQFRLTADIEKNEQRIKMLIAQAV